jgi:hypothetical protein
VKSPSFSSSASPSSSSSSVITELDLERLQHLLDRVEQVLNFFPPRAPNLTPCSTLARVFDHYKVERAPTCRHDSCDDSPSGTYFSPSPILPLSTFLLPFRLPLLPPPSLCVRPSLLSPTLTPDSLPSSAVYLDDEESEGLRSIQEAASDVTFTM